METKLIQWIVSKVKKKKIEKKDEEKICKEEIRIEPCSVPNVADMAHTCPIVDVAGEWMGETLYSLADLFSVEEESNREKEKEGEGKKYEFEVPESELIKLFFARAKEKVSDGFGDWLNEAKK